MKSPAHPLRFPATRQRQVGAAAVEFALIALFAFIPLVLGIMEFGRLFYVANTVQEVTRRAAREQVVAWISQSSAIQRTALFHSGSSSGTVTLPGGVEISNTNVRLSFHNNYADALSGSNSITSGSPEANLVNCLKNEIPCVRYVRATLATAGGAPLNYSPMTGWFGNLFKVPLPGATVIMPAEAVGLL